MNSHTMPHTVQNMVLSNINPFLEPARLNPAVIWLYEAEAARGSWLAVVSGVQSTDSGGLGLPPPSTADGYLPMTAYNTTAES